MLLKRHPPGIDDDPPPPADGPEQLDADAAAVLRWLHRARVEFVLVGPVADAIRSRGPVLGPVAVVLAPYRRNLMRLERALQGERVYSRVDGVGPGGEADLTPTKLTADMLARGQLRTLRVGKHDLDIEGSASGLPSYQELLYEAVRIEPVPGVSVEVASPEDIERYLHVRRTGIAPQITITRQAAVEHDAG
jgi:hypothetical protein